MILEFKIISCYIVYAIWVTIDYYVHFEYNVFLTGAGVVAFVMIKLMLDLLLEIIED